MNHRIVASLLFCGTLVGQESQPPVQAAHAFDQIGPFQVEVVEPVTLRDVDRDKTLFLRVYHPIGDGGPFPVVVFSHGGLANREAFASVSRHWASHGYIVVHPEHDDARRSLRHGDGAPDNTGRGGLRSILSDASRVERVKDITSVIDGLDQIVTQLPRLPGKESVDHAHIAVAGHSLGAYVAEVVGGTTTRVAQQRNASLMDKRVTCVLPISAPGVSREYGLNERSWDGLEIPMLTITGTRDRGTEEQDVEWKKDVFTRSPEGNKFLVVIEGATHFHFGGQAPGRRSMRRGSDVPTPDRMVTLVKAASVAFLDAYLRRSETARDYLQADFSRFAGAHASISSR